jgi:hypothetical protein
MTPEGSHVYSIFAARGTMVQWGICSARGIMVQCGEFVPPGAQYDFYITSFFYFPSYFSIIKNKNMIYFSKHIK